MKLTDAQWKLLEPLFETTTEGGRGRPRRDSREVRLEIFTRSDFALDFIQTIGAFRRTGKVPAPEYLPWYRRDLSFQPVQISEGQGIVGDGVSIHAICS